MFRSFNSYKKNFYSNKQLKGEHTSHTTHAKEKILRKRPEIVTIPAKTNPFRHKQQ